jgi:hypothetical protein
MSHKPNESAASQTAASTSHHLFAVAATRASRRPANGLAKTPKQHLEHPAREFNPSACKSEREIGKRAKQRKPTANTCGRMPLTYADAVFSHSRSPLVTTLPHAGCPHSFRFHQKGGLSSRAPRRTKQIVCLQKANSLSPDSAALGLLAAVTSTVGDNYLPAASALTSLSQKRKMFWRLPKRSLRPGSSCRWQETD